MARHGSPPPGFRRYRKQPGKVMTTLMCLVLTGVLAALIGLVVHNIDLLTYRTGWAGRSGTLTQVSCVRVGSGKSAHEKCAGEFTPDGTTDVADMVDVGVEGDIDYADRSYPARLHPDGRTASIVSAETIAWVIAGLLGSLLLVELVGTMLVSIAGSRIWLRWRPPPVLVIGVLWTMAATLVLAIAAAITGAIAS